MKNPSLNFIAFLLLTSVIFIAGCSEADHSADLKLKIDRYVEYWNTSDFAGIENIMHNNFEMYVSPKYEPKIGIEYFKENIINLHTAYPDFKLVIDEYIFNKDMAAGIWTITGTDTGNGSRSPTGKSIEVRGMSVLHFKEGKIIDEWISGNDLLWLQQLGYTLTAPKIEKTNRMKSSFLGLRTVVYHVGDIQSAKQWYAKAFLVEPYFDEPFYVGFNIGGYELGLLPEETPTLDKVETVVAYWGVNDIMENYDRLIGLGVAELEKPNSVGG